MATTLIDFRGYAMVQALGRR